MDLDLTSARRPLIVHTYVLCIKKVCSGTKSFFFWSVAFDGCLVFPLSHNVCCKYGLLRSQFPREFVSFSDTNSKDDDG